VDLGVVLEGVARMIKPCWQPYRPRRRGEGFPTNRNPINYSFNPFNMCINNTLMLITQLLNICNVARADSTASLADLGVVLEGVAGDGKTLLEALSAVREGRGLPSLRLLGLDAEEIPENTETSGACLHFIHTPFLLDCGGSIACVASRVEC
jgi:hypothetical protein